MHWNIGQKLIISKHYMPILSNRSKIVNIDSFRGFYDVTISQIWGVYKIMDITIEYFFLEISFYRNFAIFTHLVNKLVFVQYKVILHLWIFSKISVTSLHANNEENTQKKMNIFIKSFSLNYSLYRFLSFLLLWNN